MSRRTCSGCHPDVWFGETPATLDETHRAHGGGWQARRRDCASCHVEAPAGRTLYAPIAHAHVPLAESARYGAPELQIVEVDGLRPGEKPVVTFRLRDRYGPLAPASSNPAPAAGRAGIPATSSYVPRKLSSLSIKLAGPTTPDYGHPSTMLSSGSSGGNPDPLALTTVAGSHPTSTSTRSPHRSPRARAGTWAVGMEARRRLKYAPYDKAAGVFLWPYTGETVTESPDNPVVYVDTATGAWPAAGAAPRRELVSEASCLRCHGRLELHGGAAAPGRVLPLLPHAHGDRLVAAAQGLAGR